MKYWMLTLLLFGASPLEAAQTVTVGTAVDLQNALTAANARGGNTTIVLQDGTYTLSATLNVTASDITITGQSEVRENVIVQGDAMSATAAIGNLIRVAANNFKVSNLTLQKSRWHLIQIAGEAGASGPVVSNVVFRDAYQQLLKVSVNQANYAMTADNGLVEKSLFEYTAGIGPEYYIGGVDLHGGKNWVIRDNTFRSIISPATAVSEFAIHVWDRSANALVEKNLIINCDRGIGFGLGVKGNTGGIIRNNMIYHAANDGQFADANIELATSPGTKVYNNSVYSVSGYPNSIEYRFAATTGVLIKNNLTNGLITSRDGATGTVGSNVTKAISSWFVNAGQGDLHLATNNPAVAGGQPVAGLIDDFDGDPRPQNGVDVGADQWVSQVRPHANVRAQ